MHRWSTDAGDELVTALARERRAFEALLFRLLNARHLLDGGSARFLSWAAADLDRACERLREAELRRARVVASVSALGGGRGDETLRDLIDRAPPPYGGMLEDHRSAIGRLAAETTAAAEAAHRLAVRGRERMEAEREAAEREADERSGAGRDPVADALERELARCGYDAVADATQPLMLPSLASFLA